MTLLLKAKGTLETMEVYKSSPSTEASPAATAAGDGITVSLLKELFLLSKNQDALRILVNIVTAALHVACMLKGSDCMQGRLVSYLSEKLRN